MYLASLRERQGLEVFAAIPIFFLVSFGLRGSPVLPRTTSVVMYALGAGAMIGVVVFLAALTFGDVEANPPALGLLACVVGFVTGYLGAAIGAIVKAAAWKMASSAPVPMPEGLERWLR
jgi:hypothetical protein